MLINICEDNLSSIYYYIMKDYQAFVWLFVMLYPLGIFNYIRWKSIDKTHSSFNKTWSNWKRSNVDKLWNKCMLLFNYLWYGYYNLLRYDNYQIFIGLSHLGVAKQKIKQRGRYNIRLYFSEFWRKEDF